MLIARRNGKQYPARATRGPAGWVGVLILCVLSLAVGLLYPSWGYADDMTALTIRSGSEIDYPPFCIVHEDGRVDGFSVELMRAALDKMGREVTFRTGPWAEVRGWLERGEVQVLPLVGRTPEREPLFDFTVPYMTMHGAIVVRKETEDVRSLADLRGRRVGVMKGDNTEEFLRRENRGLEIITTPTFSDAFHALAEGRCEAVVIQRLVAVRLLEETGLTNLKIVDRPIREFSQDFCFAVKEGNREMLSVLNEGLALAVADGTHRRLHAKWFAALELPSDRPIVVGGDHNYPPFEFLDEKSRPAGFTVALTRAIARELNIDVRIQLGRWEDTVNALRDGEIDAIEGMFYSPERDRVLDFSPRYLVLHCVGMVRKGEGPPPVTIEDLAGRDIVVQADDAILDALAEHGIEARITTVETQEDVVRAVAEGRNTCGLGTRFGALYAIKKNGWTNIEVADRAFYSGQYCYAVQGGNEALLAEFTEGLRILKDSGEYQRIYEQWLGAYDPGIPTRTALKYIAFIAGPLLLIALLGVFWLWSLRRQVAARTRELRESLDRFRSVFEVANVGKSMTLPTGEVNVNKAFADMLGYAPEELRGKTWQQLTPPEDLPETERCIAPLLDGREDSVRFEKRYVRKDGGTVWADASATLLRDSQRRPLHFITTVVDITDRKRAQEALQESESRYRRLFECAKDGILILDAATGKVVDVNPYLMQLLGYDRNSLLGKPLWDIGPFHDIAASRGIFRVLQEKEYVRYEHLPLQTATGQLVDVEFVSNVYLVNDLKVIQCNIRDITDRTRAEARIEHLNRVLRAIRDVNHLITHETDRAALLRRSCEILVSTRGYRSAWVALRDARGALDGVAECGIGEDFGAVREALERGEWPECYRRALEHPDGIAAIHETSANCKACALGHVYRDTSALAGRLRHAGRDFGVLVVALPTGLADDEEEQSLFRELIGDVSYALQAMGAEQTRIRNERILQAVFQSAGDGILLAEAESGRFILGNQMICRMLGYSKEEISGLSVADIHPAETLELIRTLFDKQAQGEVTLAEDLPVKRKDGTVFSADVGAAVFELDGLRHVAGIFRDVTERKRAEKALKEAYDIINRSTSVAFTWKNAEGWPVEFVSENVQKLLGYEAEAFISGEVSYTDCIHAQDLPRVVEESAIMSAQEKTVEFVREPYRLIARDGSEKYVKDWSFIVRDNDGRITHFKGIVEDITEHRNLEAQLQQAQKMEAVGRLAGGVAHDFNNILSVILGYSELALNKVGAEDPLRENLKEIYAAANRSRDIIRQLLAFARKETIAPKVLDLNETVESMLKILQKLIGEDIDLAWHPGKVPWPVLMDPSQLDQILANLCVNARDAIADVGRITIETSAATIDADYCSRHAGFISGEFVLLAVSDDGVGMDRETLDHIFEPFFTTKGLGKGTGLGLSTVYGIVKQNNGFINVYSEPGRGTTFRIYLPGHSGEISEKQRVIDEQVPDGNGETVLVVEDEMSILKLVERILSQRNYKVLTAKSPSEALEAAQAHSAEISLLITDVVMPEMNGRELADRLKLLCPGIKCLFMSGYTADVIAHRGVLDEGVQFIQKPFSNKGLAAKVRDALEMNTK